MTSSNGTICVTCVTDLLCGEFTGPGEFPAQRPVTRSFDVFFDLRLIKRLSKQPWGWWFETPSWSLWRQCNEIASCQVICKITTGYPPHSMSGTFGLLWSISRLWLLMSWWRCRFPDTYKARSNFTHLVISYILVKKSCNNFVFRWMPWSYWFTSCWSNTQLNSFWTLYFVEFSHNNSGNN